MPLITLRTSLGNSSPNDLVAEVQPQTFEYLQTTTAAKLRVSVYLDRDWQNVEPSYVEIALDPAIVGAQLLIEKVSPGSRTRKGIVLPGPMAQGEQLTLEVVRKSHDEQ